MFSLNAEETRIVRELGRKMLITFLAMQVVLLVPVVTLMYLYPEIPFEYFLAILLGSAIVAVRSGLKVFKRVK